MRSWLARRLARYSRLLGIKKPRWPYNTIGATTTEDYGNEIFAAFWTTCNDVLPRLEIAIDSGVIVRSVWYDRRTHIIRITVASGDNHRRREELQAQMAKEHSDAYPRSARQRGRASRLATSEFARLERAIEDIKIPKRFQRPE